MGAAAAAARFGAGGWRTGRPSAATTGQTTVVLKRTGSSTSTETGARPLLLGCPERLG